ncbi:WAP four-disulfide core domain protein 5 [Grammomys surdaster]|uniref:WAP four-disulfide core domain protein 5 n=1 Tax=Grammomys surdaster TaxID=491861 RepID=UPI00109FBD18|nr:WAP four-disulfide core domain protein 5 [Grammomys surdaster]
MRVQSSLLLVVLLVLETQRHVVLCRKKGDKLGGCPPDDGPCHQMIPPQCANDYQCPSSWKCCPRSCYLQCVPRVFVKLGKCPVDQLRCLSPKKHMCNKDLDCSGKKRCCVSACGRDCRDPSKGAISPSPPTQLWDVLPGSDFERCSQLLGPHPSQARIETTASGRPRPPSLPSGSDRCGLSRGGREHRKGGGCGSSAVVRRSGASGQKTARRRLRVQTRWNPEAKTGN